MFLLGAVSKGARADRGQLHVLVFPTALRLTKKLTLSMFLTTRQFVRSLFKVLTTPTTTSEYIAALNIYL